MMMIATQVSRRVSGIRPPKQLPRLSSPDLGPQLVAYRSSWRASRHRLLSGIKRGGGCSLQQFTRQFRSLRDVSAVNEQVEVEDNHIQSKGSGLGHKSPGNPQGFEDHGLVTQRSSSHPKFAFAFDIDGVLLHESKAIDVAVETLKYLQEHKIPFILLTNGGGKAEDERVRELSQRLDNIPLSTQQFVQSHTPFKELAHDLRALQHPIPEFNNSDTGVDQNGLADRNVLVVGSDPDKLRKISKSYGFKRTFTTADVLEAFPNIFPFQRISTSSKFDGEAVALLRGSTPDSKPDASPRVRFDAIMVFNDPRDWAADTEIIIELLMSKRGAPGTYSPSNGQPGRENSGWQRDSQPRLYFSNPDLFWSTSYPLPRLGQGAFQAALAGIWDRITGGQKLQMAVIGKPHRHTYLFAEDVLRRIWNGDNRETKNKEPLERVYMIGDNPESDIRGANEFQSPHKIEWRSMLLRTGVYDAQRGPPTYIPSSGIHDHVAAAVAVALKREGWPISKGGSLYKYLPNTMTATIR